MVLRVLQELPFLDICHDPANGWIYAEWRGDISLAQAGEGGQALLHWVRATGCAKLLNDNSQVTRLWLETAEWRSISVLGQLYTAGLQYVAWVYSPDLYGRFSVDYSLLGVTVPTVRTFEDLTLAKHWLRAV